MKSVKITGLITGIVLLSIAVIGAIRFVAEPDEQIYAYHLRKGNFSDAQKAAMENTKSGEPKNYIAERDGETYRLPLPNGATEYPGGGYLVINYEFWDRYFEGLKELDGYEFDQMGNLIILMHKDGKIKFLIGRENVARRYECLHVQHKWNYQKSGGSE